LLRATSGGKSFNAKLKAIACIMKKHDYVYRHATNEAMHMPAKVYKDARSFLEEVCPILLGPHCDRRWMFNMDQTPLNFL
jgi:hypothetical protein